MERLKAKDLVTSDRLNLWLGKRFAFLKKTNEALRWLKKAQAGNDTQVAAEACLYLEGQERINGAKFEKRDALLRTAIANASDPDIVQEALFQRAYLLSKEGPGYDPSASLEALEQIIFRFPRGRRADEAYYELAARYTEQGDVDKALKYYGLLQKLPEPNRYLDSAAFEPALLLFGQRGADNLKAAREQLEGLEQRRPGRQFHAANLFWLGRFAEEENNQTSANIFFEKTIAESPYSYYAVRARMHLHSGTTASANANPDDGTLADLRAAYQRGHREAAVSGLTPYHHRLKFSLDSGLYKQCMIEEAGSRALFPDRRIEDLSLADLDAKGLIPILGLLLALRQEAMAASETDHRAPNRLEIAGGLGAPADWLTSFRITSSTGYSEGGAALEHDSRYLPTAYPKVFADWIGQAADATRMNGSKYPMSPALLYGIVRSESAFNPRALSDQEALGLFQFTPVTFSSLNKIGNELTKANVQTREAFLMNPQLSLGLGARFWAGELLPRYKGNPWLALMDHNIGPNQVRAWKVRWDKSARAGDLEYFIDSIRIRATRNFVREVFTSTAIAEAAQLFGASGSGEASMVKNNP